MAKSLRSKRQRRLRTLRRDLAQPFYDKKEAAKLSAQQAALAAPKMPVRGAPSSATSGGSDDVMATDATPAALEGMMDVEMGDGGSLKSMSSLKPSGGVGKKSKKKQKGQRKGRGKYKRQHK